MKRTIFAALATAFLLSSACDPTGLIPRPNAPTMTPVPSPDTPSPTTSVAPTSTTTPDTSTTSTTSTTTTTSTIPTDTPALPTNALHVNSQAPEGGNGSLESPLSSIQDAVNASSSVQNIVVRGGTYHETIEAYGKELHIMSYPGERAVIDGAEELTGWTASGNTWKAHGFASTQHRSYAANEISSSHPDAGSPEQVFINGMPLTQVGSTSEVTASTFHVDRATKTVTIGTNPVGKLVEESTLERGIYLNHAHNSTLTNITVQRFALPAKEFGAIRAYANNVSLTGVTSRLNAYDGVSVIGSHATLTNIDASNNGHNGIHANTADHFTLTNSTISNNNAANFNQNWSNAAIKLTRSQHVNIENNTFDNNAGNGVWCDQSCFDVNVINNVISNNQRSAVMLELSANGVVAGNTITNTGRFGVYVLESSSVEIWNNTIVDAYRGIYVVDGSRIATDIESRDHDRRYPVPNPQIPWEVHNINIHNNIIAQLNAPNALMFIASEDVTRQKSMQELGITSNNNVFWSKSASTNRWFSGWVNYPHPIMMSNDFQQHQYHTGQDLDSVSGTGPTNPYFTMANGVPTPTTAASNDAVATTMPENIGNALGVSSAARPLGAPQ